MRLLLDTHVLLAIAERDEERLPPGFVDLAREGAYSLHGSVASLWEAAIKHRLGKLPLPCPLSEWPELLLLLGVSILDIRTSHILAETDPLPDTKDPFDRLLLAICHVEDMRLVTVDKQLLGHQLAWDPGAA
jgi:PIN domain nuclease of toxin-antitoxin system